MTLERKSPKNEDKNTSQSYLSSGLRYIQNVLGYYSTSPEKTAPTKPTDYLNTDGIKTLTLYSKPYLERSIILDELDWDTFLSNIDNDEGLRKVLSQACDDFYKLKISEVEHIVNLAYFIHLNFLNINSHTHPTVKKWMTLIVTSIIVHSCELSVENHLKMATLTYAWGKHFEDRIPFVLSHADNANKLLSDAKESDACIQRAQINLFASLKQETQKENSTSENNITTASPRAS